MFVYLIFHVRRTEIHSSQYSFHWKRKYFSNREYISRSNNPPRNTSNRFCTDATIFILSLHACRIRIRHCTILFQFLPHLLVQHNTESAIKNTFLYMYQQINKIRYLKIQALWIFQFLRIGLYITIQNVSGKME